MNAQRATSKEHSLCVDAARVNKNCRFHLSSAEIKCSYIDSALSTGESVNAAQSQRETE